MTVRSLGLQSYSETWEAMKQFTTHRDKNTPDEVWFLQHHPVYTQGQAGKPEHVLNAQDIPIVQSDRGGQITYHGPGQLVIYVLIDLTRRKLGVRTLVCILEKMLIDVLAKFDVLAETQTGAPGVYVHHQKIASIGLRVRKGCTYHGIALNIGMDLTPFLGINPCGFEGLKMTQLQNHAPNIELKQVETILKTHFLDQFGEKAHATFC
ncbi:MAG: lipoyl(octanoyl) transferase LipB [Gammaproteobacteria bacterium]|nr:lipoyl(octanoyl) transferase LipB [Gammaproteobacteria bacterium]